MIDRVTDDENRAARNAAADDSSNRRCWLAAADAGTWEWDVTTGALAWSPELFRLYDLDPARTSPRHADWERCLHPDDREATNRAVRDVLEGITPDLRSEFRIVRRDGSVRWVLTIGGASRDSQGRVSKLRGINIDVTARKEAELALTNLNRTLEQRVAEQTGQIRLLAAALEHLADGVIITDDEVEWPGTAIRFVNKALCRITGYSAAELIGQTPRLLQGDLSDPQVMADLNRELAAGQPYLCEVVSRRKDGSPYDAELIISPLYDPSGRRTNFVAIYRDVTERNRVSHALRDREQRLSAILASAFDAIVTIDREGIIVSANPATERLFGYAQDELVGRNVSMLMASPHRDEHDAYIRRYVETGVARIIGSHRVGIGVRKNGDTFPVDLSISAINQHGFTGIIRDLSERKSLQKHVLEVAEEEQRRIGQELHDGVQQELTGLSLIAETIADDLRAIPSSRSQSVAANSTRFDVPGDIDVAQRARTMLARLTTGLGECARHVQLLSRGIMPVQVDGRGLHSALQELAHTTSLPGLVDCVCKIDERAAIDDAATATHLYRITQEAVNNAIKHGRASRIQLSLERRDDRMILEISDNGSGIDPTTFDVASPPAAGMGLRIMAYRSSLIGGTLHFLRSPDGGTIVRCTLQEKGVASI